MFQPVWQPILMVGSPDIILHSAERRALAWDHPNRFSALRNALYQARLLEQPRPENRIALLGQDLLEDTIYTTVGAYLFAGVSCIQRLGGHVPFTPSFTGQNIWTMPKWASRLLHQVRMMRYFSAYWAVGMTYFTTYNILTGFMGFPVNEYHNYQPQASVLSVIPTALIYAALHPNRRPERLWVGKATPFVGRFFLSGIVGAALAVFAARRFAHATVSELYHPSGSDSYFETLRNSAPSADLVADMPYIPFYKEARCSPGLPVKSPYYDPEYVAKAKEEVKRKLDSLY
uniref:NDUFA11 n=1 Tax=Euglena gracilis TaxID=3039 RepID=UPI002FE4FB65